jgi:hypothetical protein
MCNKVLGRCCLDGVMLFGCSSFTYDSCVVIFLTSWTATVWWVCTPVL